MSTLNLAQANKIIAKALEKAREMKIKPVSVVVLDDGGCINCTAGEGNPIEIMDLSFGVQVAAVDLLAREAGSLAPAVHLLPPEVDDRVARAKLEALGLRIDAPSSAQRDFLGSWTSTGRRAAPQRDGARS